MYENSKNKVFDKICYDDCITGMDNIESESIDLIIADPPFGIEFTGKEKFYNRDSSNVIKGYDEVRGDYAEFSHKWISKIERIMKETSSAYIVSGYTNLNHVLNAINSTNLVLKNHIIWKYQFGVFCKKKYVSSHYHVIFLVKNDKKYYFNRITHYNEDVWIIPRTNKAKQEKNGTKLPNELVRKMIDFSSKPADLVFDPFQGNGTTAITSKQNYRHYYGFESNLNMKRIIDNNIQSVIAGDKYSSYSKRLKTPEELSKISSIYMRAYKEFIRKGEKNSQSK